MTVAQTSKHSWFMDIPKFNFCHTQAFIVEEFTQNETKLRISRMSRKDGNRLVKSINGKYFI